MLTVILGILIASLIFVGLALLLRSYNKPLIEEKDLTRKFGRSWRGTIVKVSDGDTLILMRKASNVKVRLWAVDCPEKNQPFGNEATKFVVEFCLGKSVIVTPVNHKDLFGRTIGIITLVDEQIVLNKELVRRGLAWWYQPLAKSRKEYKTLEEEARQKKVGLWMDNDPVAPWIWRKQHKRIWKRLVDWVRAEDYYYS